MSPDVTISFAGHTIHISNFDLVLACALIFALAVVELAFSLGRRATLRRRTNRLLDQLERVVPVLERVASDLTARSAVSNSGSEENVLPVPPPQPAEWSRARSRQGSVYSMFGR